MNRVVGDGAPGTLNQRTVVALFAGVIIAILSAGYIVVASLNSGISTKLDRVQTHTLRDLAEAQYQSCRRGNVIRFHVNANTRAINRTTPLSLHPIPYPDCRAIRAHILRELP
jgi:hypothetical protein